MRLLPIAVALSLAPVLLAQQAEAQPAKKDAAAGEVSAEAAEPVVHRVPYLKIAGSYQDLPEMGFDPTALLMGGGGPKPKPFFQLLEILDDLAKAPESEVLLDLSSGIGLNLAQQREVERAMDRLLAAGKRLVCYLENPGITTYQIAAQCDHVVIADMGGLDLRSPAMSVMHMKDALDLLGVQVEVTRVGEFKGAVEPYMRSSISEHLRKHYEAMLTSMNSDIVRRIAKGRMIPAAEVRAAQAQRMFTAREAKAAGFVDRIVPWTGAKRAFEVVRGGDTLEFVNVGPKKKKQRRDIMSLLTSMLRATKEEKIEDPQVVVMHLSGQIVDGNSPNPGMMVSGVAAKKLDELAENELVKGVVIRINSPGGSATASEEIRLAIERLAAKKPVVFSMGELAASGGYWITTIGRPILAEVGTITGSIGVFGMRMQPGPLMRRIGLHTDIVRLDDGPLMDAMDRPWSDEARARIQGFVDEVYDRFLAHVGRSRGMATEAVDKIAGGRVWSGQQAVENGLVDAIGGVDDALAMVRKEAELGDDVEVLHVPKPKSFADSLFSSIFEARIAAAAGASARTEVLRLALADWLRHTELFGVLREALTGHGKTRIYAMMPAGLRVR
ncbi:MAG: signal peptide peptidase SppA [bacterium]|nr:signal peptide peptidase SppA [bacterium]